jgi:hypothetical protein
LTLPADILQALSEGKISDGHTRPLLMLVDRPEEQMTLFKEIVYKKMTVREAEAVARKIAYDRVRKKDRAFDPELVEIEAKFKESLGTRVHIERKDTGGKLTIDFFSADDLRDILDRVTSAGVALGIPTDKLTGHIEKTEAVAVVPTAEGISAGEVSQVPEVAIDDRAPEEVAKDDNTEIQDDELYSLKNFSV